MLQSLSKMRKICDTAVVLLLLWAGLVIVVAQTLSKLSEVLPGDWGTLCFASDK